MANTELVLQQAAIRQQQLAAWIGHEFLTGEAMTVVDEGGAMALGGLWSFDVPEQDMPLSIHWMNHRLCDMVWWAVAHKLKTMATYRVIDHAWMFGHADPPWEPWGFVTEPYMDAAAAKTLCAAVQNELDGWGVALHVLPKDRSAWSPGACTPIIAVLKDGAFESLSAEAVRYLFPIEEEDGPPDGLLKLS